MEIVTLTNGVRVANFSSPHSFTFEDGTILPAVSNEIAEKYKVTFLEGRMKHKNKPIYDITLRFELSADIIDRMEVFKELWTKGELDIVLCPLPMLTQLKKEFYDLFNSPFRTIRVENRITKEISITKFCL